MKLRLFLLAFITAGLFAGCASSPKKKEDNGIYKPGIYKSGKSVTFVYKAAREDITNVCITGDFNNWQKKGIPLNFTGEIWTITFVLEYGIYQYKYILNGTEMTSDPYADAYAPDGKGGKNSIVEVKKE